MKDVSALKPPPFARIGDPVSSVSTPALVLDLDAFDANTQRMAELARRHGVALRPHAKAHKSTAIALRQLELGAVGVCCQKMSEAYPFAAKGVLSIHISNEFVGADKVAMAIELANYVRLSVCVDHVAQVEALGLAATQAGVSITVLPEVDIGQGRCGVKGNDALAALVDRIVAHKGLRFGGLQAYHGGIQHLASWEQRRQAAETAAQATAQYVQFLAARGIACDVITGGGTGTAEFDVSSGVYTEIQPGSYVFMDGDYGSKDWQGGWKPAHSLFIASTVMSTGKPGMAVCDVGLKGVAVDSGLPVLRPGDHGGQLQYKAANDEHGILQIAAGDTRDYLGERLFLIPGHCDPTANLYQQYVGYRRDVVECIWEIDARGLSQ
ncbi:DSD1 family PLP-dependent enzyme [Herminiimonas glaciei]|uniref:DSD1 family PLP-dependent enzyme n=1 Tax=Herminiimonas glaciei TaxID=523788 RepID=A0ABW2IG17_9BURK